ncbi:unnamed protein product [Durusdinium trenchii]|uniref:Uncharacterized protein n=1 Tax=Durusdinium trenchii TaxID=1381693 RepID=A0ABP0HFH5_9DINO
MEVPSWLLQRGAALHSAAEGGHSRVIRQLLRARAQFQLDASGRQPLHLAATAGHVAAAQQLLEADADPTVASARQEQPLHLATSSCRLTHLLLAFRAAVSAEDHEGVQAIHWAAASGSHCVVRALLASKASLASGDRVHGGQPIHWAAANGRVKMVPMHWAAGNGQRQAAEELRDLVWRAVSKRVLGWPPNAAGQSRGGFVYKGSICFLSRHGDLGCIMCILSISEPDKFSEAPS